MKAQSITVDEWTAELQRLDAMLDIPSEIPAGVGFTIHEYAKAKKCSRETIARRVREMVESGDVRIIGRRGRAVVYELGGRNGNASNSGRRKNVR